MMYARFALLVMADLSMNLAGYLINPVLPLFANAVGKLPTWLSWFGQHDSTLDGAEIRFITSTFRYRNYFGQPKNKRCRYWLRVLWLYRNNAYGFSYSVLGAKGPFTELSADGILPADRYPAREGRHLQIVQGADGTDYFQYRYVKDRGNGKCFEARIGWKFNDLADSRAQLVLRWTPTRRFEAQPPI